jgi:hypothetical protein
MAAKADGFACALCPSLIKAAGAVRFFSQGIRMHEMRFRWQDASSAAMANLT